MMDITYRGIRFQWTKTENWLVEPVMTPDGADYVCSKIELDVYVTLNPQTVSYIRGGPNAITPVLAPGELASGTESAIRHLLAQPRGQLVVHNIRGQPVLSSPPDGLNCDVQGGPYVKVLGPPVMMGDRTWLWHLRFTTFINENYVSATENIGPLLSNRFTQGATVDLDAFTVIVTKGEAVFDLGQLVNRGVSADNLRKFLFVPIPDGFRRTVQIDQTGDGSTLNYTLVDQQVSHGYGVAQRIEAIQTASNSRTGLFTVLGGMAFDNATTYSDSLQESANAAEDGIVRALDGHPPPPVGFLQGIARPLTDGFSRMARNTLTTVVNHLPRLYQAIAVRCWGNPSTPRQTLSALALGIAYARINTPRLWGKTELKLTEDLTGKFSEVHLITSIGLAEAIGADVINGGFALLAGQIPDVQAINFLTAYKSVSSCFNGERILVNAPNINFTLDQGLSIASPGTDGLSRGSYAADLLYQALTAAGAAPAAVNPNGPTV